MKKDIRMIALDLDGTLLTDKKEILPYTKEVLKKVIDQGVMVLIASGRPLAAIDAELAAFPEMRYALTSNGSRIDDVKENRLLLEKSLSMEKTLEVIEKVKTYDLVCEVFANGKGYQSARDLDRIHEFFDTPEMVAYIRRTRTAVEDVREIASRADMHVEKVHLIFNDLDMRKEVKTILAGIEGVGVTGAFPNTIEAHCEGVSKGNGLIELGKMLGIDREQIMVCGDGLNDYEMIEKCGFGVAMENGNPKVKAIADYVTASNNEDGVGKAIAKFVLK